MDVSVVCPVFDTDPVQLQAAIASVLAQAELRDCEVILVDDCSTNAGTLAILDAAPAGDDRVRVVRQPRNAGPGAARTAGVAQARHGWIGFIDSDDLWPAGKIGHAGAVLRERPDSRWISGNYATLADGGTLLQRRHLSEVVRDCQEGTAAHRLHAPALTSGLVQEWLPLGTSLVRKDLFHEAGGFDPRLLYGEDWLLCLRLSTYAPMDYTEADTYVLRRQGMSMMRSPGRMSARLAHSGHLARRDPRLRSVRRELRWWQYKTYKDIAMNNALNGRKAKGLSYAVRALLVDPREVRDMLLFLRQLPLHGTALASGLQGYSTAEQVILAQLAGAGQHQAAAR